MIPLSSTESTEKFPRSTLAWIIFLTLLHVLSYFGFEKRLDFLMKFSAKSSFEFTNDLLSIFVFGHWPALFVALIFSWAFLPIFFEKRRAAVAFIFSIIGALLALRIFFWVHTNAAHPLLGSDALIGSLLGMAMRHNLWGSVYTLVLGPFWLRVLEVPSYVLFFFWLFYIFLASFGLESPFSEARMLYLLPLIGFLWGFLGESCFVFLEKIIKKDKLTASSDSDNPSPLA